jgi:16S rRNA (guanine527-N7)-methyltransferase
MEDQLRELLISGAKKLGIQLDDNQIVSIEWLLEHLIETNQRFNLTAIKTREEIVVKHFLDSWSCCLDIKKPGSLIDIGSGAGFPGLAIKIVQPEIDITMVEVIQKKAGFIEECIRGMNLTGIQVTVGRAEELGRKEGWRGYFDYATCRAVGHLSIVAEYCLPLLKIGGLLIAQKGTEVNVEVAEATIGIKTLGGRIEQIHWVSNELLLGRCLVLIRKEEDTPDAYPRRVGIPRKRPLISR